MGKRKRGGRRSNNRPSAGRMPKGLPVRQQQPGGGISSSNPFEAAASRKSWKPKHAVHNDARRSAQPSSLGGAGINNDGGPSTSAALERRRLAVRAELKSGRKANVFSDGRIGEGDARMTARERNLARLVRERSRRSKRSSKYSLSEEDGDGGGRDEEVLLTHGGKAVDQLTAADHVILSDGDDDEVYGDVMGADGNRLDADLHFGGGTLGRGGRDDRQRSIYGGGGGAPESMADLYSQRKTELDDLIKRRKLMKAERQKTKEEQVETFTSMDESFRELAGLLSFRDKGKEARQEAEAIRRRSEAKKNSVEDGPADRGDEEEDEMAEWDKEMKRYQFLERKVKATDRTKTPEEIAKEEADRLHKLETRRLARMSGDFDDDSLTDIDSEDDDGGSDGNRSGKKKSKKVGSGDNNNPEALDNDSDDEDDDGNELKVRFTADGLVEIDKNGKYVRKVGEEEQQKDEEEEEDDDNDNSAAPDAVLAVGTRVSASYHAKEQYAGLESWYSGVVAKVHQQQAGKVTYDIEYDDGDYEENVEPQNVKVFEKSDEERKKEAREKMKRKKAKEKARIEIPYVFEVPTTLDALHDLIATYASKGEDASLIIRRIHGANSVKLNRRNLEKMQNFADVLLRRFVAVGDAIFESGDGGPELGRYRQLDALTETMYNLAQDAPDSAAAVWSRRLGFFQNAHAKRLRDAELVDQGDDESEDDDDEDGRLKSAWPSTGVFLSLRALGHIFPVSDRRHPIVTPALLLLGEFVAHTPVESMYDLVMGTMCAGLLVEYTKEAKRVVPESLAFFASVIRLFAPDSAKLPEMFPQPSLGAASSQEPFLSLRSKVLAYDGIELPLLSLCRKDIENDKTAVAILTAALHIVEGMVTNLAGSMMSAETECFFEITKSLLELQPKSKKKSFPQPLQKKIAAAVTAISEACQHDNDRLPLQRRPAPSVRDTAIKTLAPRLENPERYSFSKDKKKDPTQAALDRTRREVKREHKAISRELRLDAALVEETRRQEKDKKDSAARAKRHKAFAWLEGEQAAMNQQVRQGGGLLQGGGTGAARAKARTGKLGMKKGGKF